MCSDGGWLATQIFCGNFHLQKTLGEMMIPHLTDLRIFFKWVETQPPVIINDRLGFDYEYFF